MYWEFTDGTKIEKTRENMLNLVVKMYNDMIENEIYFKKKSNTILKCTDWINSDCFACDFLDSQETFVTFHSVIKNCEKCPFSIYKDKEKFSYSCIQGKSPYRMYEEILEDYIEDDDLSKSDKKKIRKICFEICQLFIDAE